MPREAYESRTQDHSRGSGPVTRFPDCVASGSQVESGESRLELLDTDARFLNMQSGLFVLT